MKEQEVKKILELMQQGKLTVEEAAEILKTQNPPFPKDEPKTETGDEWSRFTQSMENIGKTLFQGLGDIGRQVAQGGFENPFEKPRDVLFQYGKITDEKREKIWEFKIPVKFLMGFRSFLENNPRIFGNPAPFDFKTIFRELALTEEGLLWEMENSDTQEYWSTYIIGS